MSLVGPGEQSSLAVNELARGPSRGRHGLAWPLCPRATGAGRREGDRARRCHVGSRLEGVQVPCPVLPGQLEPSPRSGGQREAGVNDSLVHLGAVTGLEAGKPGCDGQ